MSMILTQRYVVGPYKFRSYLPRVGTPQDVEQWTACIKGVELPERFPTLEAAMQAAINHRMSAAHDAPTAKSE